MERKNKGVYLLFHHFNQLLILSGLILFGGFFCSPQLQSYSVTSIMSRHLVMCGVWISISACSLSLKMSASCSHWNCVYKLVSYSVSFCPHFCLLQYLPHSVISVISYFGKRTFFVVVFFHTKCCEFNLHALYYHEQKFSLTCSFATFSWSELISALIVCNKCYTVLYLWHSVVFC